jgi:hypothetical protein
MLVQEMFPVTFQQVVNHGFMDGLAKKILGNIARMIQRLRNSKGHTVIVKDSVAYGTRRKWSGSMSFLPSLLIEILHT